MPRMSPTVSLIVNGVCAVIAVGAALYCWRLQRRLFRVATPLDRTTQPNAMMGRLQCLFGFHEWTCLSDELDGKVPAEFAPSDGDSAEQIMEKFRRYATTYCRRCEAELVWNPSMKEPKVVKRRRGVSSSSERSRPQPR